MYSGISGKGARAVPQSRGDGRRRAGPAVDGARRAGALGLPRGQDGLQCGASQERHQEAAGRAEDEVAEEDGQVGVPWGGAGGVGECVMSGW